MKKFYSIILTTVFISAIASSAIAGKKLPGNELMFNPQPEPPGRPGAYKVSQASKVAQPGKVFKLNNGQQAIMMNKRMYLLTPARTGRYKTSKGMGFNINARGIIVIDARK